MIKLAENEAKMENLRLDTEKIGEIFIWNLI
jgi:hypothetical protein